MNTFHGVTLSWRVDASVVEVELHRAPCNEIGTATLAELEQLVAFLAAGAGGARAMLLWSSKGAGFSAGADLRELYDGMQGGRAGGLRALAASLRAPVPKGSRVGLVRDVVVGSLARGRRVLTQPLVIREVRRFLHRIHAVFDALDTTPLVTVSALHGVVFGGGLELALTTDVRVADRTMRLAFPELRLGIVPGFGGVPRLEREVGNAVVRDLLFTGRSLNAERARELGIVSQVTAPGEHVEVARRAARQATRFPADTTARAKAFAKKLPRARLDEEIETFLTMMREPHVEAALHKFVHAQDPRPYLP
jgi:enoyl-CoA hydratase/carnithine racemase